MQDSAVIAETNRAADLASARTGTYLCNTCRSRLFQSCRKTAESPSLLVFSDLSAPVSVKPDSYAGESAFCNYCGSYAAAVVDLDPVTGEYMPSNGSETRHYIVSQKNTFFAPGPVESGVCSEPSPTPFPMPVSHRTIDRSFEAIEPEFKKAELKKAELKKAEPKKTEAASKPPPNASKSLCLEPSKSTSSSVISTLASSPVAITCTAILAICSVTYIGYSLLKKRPGQKM